MSDLPRIVHVNDNRFGLYVPQHERLSMSEQIEPGTEFRFEHDPEDVRWRVQAFIGIAGDETESWEVYRCKQISGDPSIYSADRREDETIDFVGDAIRQAIGSVGR